MTSRPTMENPREAGPKPQFPQESLEYPGLELEITTHPSLPAGTAVVVPARSRLPRRRDRLRGLATEP
jgi:hypothetical protein